MDADLRPDVPRRALIRAAVASRGPTAFAVLDSAAELHAIAGLRSTAQVHVSVPVSDPRSQPRVDDPRIVVHQLTASPDELASVAGVATTTAVRTVADLILRTDRFAGVSVIDSALNRRLISVDDIVGIERIIWGRRGAIAARRYLALADGRSESPLETRVRLRCVDGGVAPHDLQHPIRDEDGYLVAVADLAWPAARVVAEADGRGPHAAPGALFEDRQRQNRIANAGWRVLRFTWSDALRPDYIPYVVRSALRSSR